MGISRDLYHDGSLDDWQTWTLTIINSLTFIITMINIIYLCKNMPKAHHPHLQKANDNEAENEKKDEDHPSFIHSSSVPTLHRQKSIQSVLLSVWRTQVIQYFYIIAIIPMLIAYPAHYGAQYPSKSIWIFPALDIIVTIAFLTFMRMLIISCDGIQVIQFYLESKEDLNARFKCGKKGNAFLGWKSRMKYCYLIVIKPLIDYIFSYFEYYYGSPHFQNGLRIGLKIAIIICTFFPVRGLKMFHGSLEKYSRMKRTNIKTNFVTCLAPGIQIQQLLISFLFNFNAIPGFDHINKDFQWCALYGMILCFEMMLFAIFVTYAVFNPIDLCLWDDTDILLADQNDNTIIDSITTTMTRTYIPSNTVGINNNNDNQSKFEIIMEEDRISNSAKVN